MKVLFDYQAFSQKWGGVSRYHTELYNGLLQYNHIPVLPAIFTDNVYLDSSGIRHRRLLPLGKYRPYVQAWLNQRICKRAVRLSDYDIFHPTFVNPYYDGVLLTEARVVVTVHDLIQEKTRRADAIQTGLRRAKQLERASAIVCVSEQTKDDLLDIYPQCRDKMIRVIYHGNRQQLPHEFGMRIFSHPYILYVGGRESYKNFIPFLKAFSLIDKDLHLVCTGHSFCSEEMSVMSQLDIASRVHQLFVSDAQLTDLYHYAEAFVYPSTMEGFGIPILESFRCGCPVVASDIKCFHEVAVGG